MTIICEAQVTDENDYFWCSVCLVGNVPLESVFLRVLMNDCEKIIIFVKKFRHGYEHAQIFF